LEDWRIGTRSVEDWKVGKVLSSLPAFQPSKMNREEVIEEIIG
jgi:hypothetical protein